MPTLLITADSDSRLRVEAMRLAEGILCRGHADPHACAVCRRIEEGSHPDFRRVAPEGAQIKVEAVRDAIRFAAGRPYEAPGRVVWVESAETLREGAAANALLKSLEEPGRFLTWILTTTVPDALLGTIRSRCELRRLPRRSSADRAAELARSGLAASDVDDAVAFERDPGEDLDLETAREIRREALAALGSGATSPLLALAASAAEAEEAPGIVAGLLRDAAVLASGGAADRLRHRAVAADIAAVARVHSSDALRRAAVEVDALPERFQRFAGGPSTRRLGWERALLDLVSEG
ncbi:MAG TPA: hypothetical protein VKH46_14010 [Thermoanaerobaculia bacterium]|nr:hypothetical protein [Thermoanaerobaculia bacterium]